MHFLSKCAKKNEIWNKNICNNKKKYLLCRGDNVIDICEMKYCQSEYVLTEKYEQHLRERSAAFVHFTKAKEALHTVLITTYGLRSNLYSGSINAVVTMDDLFASYV